jgi:hypothetical protein
LDGKSLEDKSGFGSRIMTMTITTKTRIFFASILIARLVLTARAADSSCRPMTIPSKIELAAGRLVVADLLPSDACPAIRSAAGQLDLGRIPLAGSPRVLTRDQVRSALRKLEVQENLGAESATIPERIIVRRQADRAVPPEPRKRSAPRPPNSLPPAAPPAPANGDLVRRGQTVILVWDQDGIRVQVPAQCLDRGALGGEVRARILQSGVVVRATVVGAGGLRAVS